MKRPQNPTAYPYLPFELVTEHFGWSYEFNEQHKQWRYHIWFAKDNLRVLIETFYEKSRTRAIETCKKYELFISRIGV